jgi:aminopeptidase N
MPPTILSPLRVFRFVSLALIVLALSFGFSACRGPRASQHSKPKSSLNRKELNAAIAQQDTPAWVAPPSAYQPTREQTFRLLHTTLDLQPDWNKQYLYGKATLRLMPWFYSQDSLVLDAKGMDILKVTRAQVSPNVELNYRHADGKLYIQLGQRLSKSDTLQIHIHYVAKPNEQGATGGTAIGSDKGLYFINPLGLEPEKPRQFWTQGETQAASSWFPTIDAPNQRSTMRLSLTVDTGLVTLSNGLKISTKQNGDGTITDVWEQKLGHAPYLFMMAAGKFSVIKDNWRGREVSYYVEPAYAPYARLVFGRTPQMIEFYSKRFGVDYVWDKYSQIVVRDFVSGAMENTSATVHMSGLQRDPRAYLDASLEEYVSHELAHQWFGDLVTCESWGQLPLNESFATYCEYLWAEHQYDHWSAEAQLHEDLVNYLAEAEEQRLPLIRYNFASTDGMFDAHSYQKGGRVLHMLRHELGDDAFFAGLKLYLTRNAFHAVEINHLRLALEEVSGRDLKPFFDQWFMQPGHPQLLADYRYDGLTGLLRVHVQQLQNTKFSPLYSLPLEIAVDKANSGQPKRVMYPVQMNTADTTYLLNVGNTEPLNAWLDGGNYLLASISEDKPTSWEHYAALNGERYQERYQAMASLSQEVEDAATRKVLIQVARTAPHPKLRIQALDVLENLEKLPDSVLATIQYLAERDPKAPVRTRAVQLLVRALPAHPELKKVFLNKLTDSSYATVAAALNACSEFLKGDSLLMQARPLANLPSPVISKTVAELLLDARDSTALSYTMRTVTALDPSLEKVLLLGKLGRYMLVVGEKEREIGFTYLKNIARDDHSWFIRLTAINGLSIFRAKPEIASYFQELLKRETSPAVLKVLKGE